MENKNIIRLFWDWKLIQKVIEHHQNFTGSFKKSVEALDEFQDP